MSKTIDPQKFCKNTQIDINNIYLGPSQILSPCTCPPPPKFLESKPIDEGYLYDSRYISKEDRIKYENEYNQMIKEREAELRNYYDYRPIQMVEKNYFEEEPEEEFRNEHSEEEDEDEYIDDGDFEIVGKK